MKLTKETALDAITDARKQARAATKDARREARRRVIRARIAAAKTQTKAQERTRTRASGLGAKAAGAAGAIGVAAGYFLREAGNRGRQEQRVSGQPTANDQALADRVKSEIFQPADAPNGSVNVNVERGVVYLRGEVQGQEEIKKLVAQAGAVDGVAGVESLLHAP
jgi:osmotically-inducible protein OsmY